MATITSFKTLKSPTTAIFKDKGSQFIGYAFPVENEAEIQACLHEVKKEHFKARHHCYAWRINPDGLHFRSNDDREPSGTAGRPILGQIDSAGLTNTFIVVVRYFGGTLLGTSGLINAYKTAAAAAIKKTEILTKNIEAIYRFDFDYKYMPAFMQAVKTMGFTILKEEYGNKGSMEITFPVDEIEPNIIRLLAAVLNVSVEEAAVSDLPKNYEYELLGKIFV